MSSSEKKPTADEAADMLAAALDARQSLMGLMFAARKMPQDLRAADRSLPLTIIGGFLGAGKTTVLNQLLVKPHGRRLVVLVNDFGSINIDAALVSSRTEDVIGLTNGCACCNVSGDLTRALIDIAQQEEAPDAIVLEASGLAEPGGIAQIALMNPAIRVDGMVSLVDAVTLKERATDPQTRALFRNQLAAADLLVLPYRRISQSGVLYLALSLGVPVVASAVGAWPDLLTNGEQALLVEPGSPSALADALVRALRDPGLRERLAAGGGAVARAHAWPAVAERTEQAFRALLARLAADQLQ